MNHKDLRLGSCVSGELRAVVFAVGAGEDRDQDLGTGGREAADGTGGPGGCKLRNGGALLGQIAGIDVLQPFFVEVKQVGGMDGLPFTDERSIFGAEADQLAVFRDFNAFHDKRAVTLGKAAFQRKTVRKAEAEAVAKGHLHYGLGHTAKADSPGGDCLSAAKQTAHAL